MISLEEHQFTDGNSNIELLIESTLPTTLDLILDKNTQLMFDQDANNLRLYIARSLDKGSVLSLLSCVRNMGWNIAASNGYYSNEIITRKFYFEKLLDLSKIVIIEPLKSKKNSRMALRFDTKPSSEPSSAQVASNLAEFSRAIDRATQEPQTSIDEAPRPTALKPRRSSIAEGKPSLVFKQLAERRKISTHSSHPLDPKFVTEAVSTDAESAPIPPAPLADRVLNRASSSPPPLRSISTSVPFSNSQPEEIKSLKKGNVGGLANLFANQLVFQPGGAPPPMRKKTGQSLPFLLFIDSS